MLPLEEVGEGAVDLALAGLGEHDGHAAPIEGIALSAHEAPGFKAVDPVRHGAARDEGLAADLPG